MSINDLSYPVVVIGKQMGESFSICNQHMLDVTTPLTVKRGLLQRSFIVDMSGARIDILSVSLRKPRNFALQILDELILNTYVQINLVLGERTTIAVSEFAERVRRAFDDQGFREIYEDLGFDVDAFDEFRNSADSVAAVIQYIIDHSSETENG